MDNSSKIIGARLPPGKVSVFLDNRTDWSATSSNYNELLSLVRFLVAELTLFGAKIPYQEASNIGGVSEAESAQPTLPHHRIQATLIFEVPFLISGH